MKQSQGSRVKMSIWGQFTYHIPPSGANLSVGVVPPYCQIPDLTPGVAPCYVNWGHLDKMTILRVGAILARLFSQHCEISYLGDHTNLY